MKILPLIIGATLLSVIIGGSTVASPPVPATGRKMIGITAWVPPEMARSQITLFHLRPMAEAPRDGTPIVALLPITDEGDFLTTVFWTQGVGWDSTASWTYREDELLGWIGKADDLFTALITQPSF